MTGWDRTLAVGVLVWLAPVSAGGQAMQPGDWTLSDTAPARHIDLSIPKADEQLTVIGRRKVAAPVGHYGQDRTAWELERVHRDMMTGADIAAFGNAYALSSPMGSDERSNETGGQFIAPRHN